MNNIEEFVEEYTLYHSDDNIHIDIIQDEHGEYSIYFRDKLTNKEYLFETTPRN